MSNLGEGIYEDGIEKGLERGREEAAREKARIVANNLTRGLSHEEIATFLGITVDEVHTFEAKANA